MSAMEWKLGMSSCSTHNVDRKTFEDYAANGIEMMEISISSEDMENLDRKAVKRASDETGVKLWSLHLPFYPFDKYNIVSLDRSAREKAIEYQSEYIKYASDMGIGIAVIHPSGEPNEDKDREELLKVGADALARLAETAAAYNVTVAVEDLPRTCLGNCSSDIKKLISENDKLRVCFDTNHLLIEKNVDFVKALGDKIITLHVSDYDFCNERHWLPYEGKIDWVELVTALEDVGYNGPFMYEIALKTPDNIKRRDLTYADFVENYRACVEKRPFAPFGVPNMEECMRNAYFKEPVI